MRAQGDVMRLHTGKLARCPGMAGNSTSPSVISWLSGSPEHTRLEVTQIAQAKSPTRPQRLHLADSIPIVLRCQDGHRFPAKLQTVSVTGGLIGLAPLLPPGSMVKVLFVTPKGPVSGTAEMLRAVSWTEQPFRFATILDVDQRRLRAVIDMVYGDAE